MLALFVVFIQFYCHLYSQKTSAFAGAGDALGLRGGYSSASIVNDRRETKTRLKPVRTSARPLKSITFTRVATSSHGIGKSEKSVMQADR